MRAVTLRPFLFLLAVATAIAARAQSFNVDVDLFNSGPDVGGGAPSPLFGAAAGQAGFWNALPINFPGPFNLTDIAGGSTSVSMSATGTGFGGGWNNPSNTGDFALLLNDAQHIGDNFTYSISGLRNGAYLVYTYVVTPVPGNSETARVALNGADPQVVSGPMPGNSFLLGVTHSLHQLQVTDGSLVIGIERISTHAYVNGFQIVAVPEPCTGLAMFGLTLSWIHRRRRAEKA